MRGHRESGGMGVRDGRGRVIFEARFGERERERRRGREEEREGGRERERKREGEEGQRL